MELNGISTYVNTSLVVNTNVMDQPKSHVYDHLQRGCITRFKQNKDCIMLCLIGVLFIAVTVLAILVFIGLPEKSAIDGGWSAWSDWGTCSATCGTGLQRRNRTCSNPAPDSSGKPCFGDVSDNQVCNMKACGMKNCREHLDNGIENTGFKTIFPDDMNPVEAQCVMDIDKGGWTVIQKRESNSRFYRGWQEYRDGFGDETNFWLGLKNIHLLTAQGDYELRIDMKKRDGSHAAAKYSNFSVGNESTGFTLFVDGYSFDPTLVNPGDSLTGWHNGRKFSTYDNDNDANNTVNCAQSWQGAWWYSSCHSAHLNGVYGNITAAGIIWSSWNGWTEPLPYTRMMIRPKRV